MRENKKLLTVISRSLLTGGLIAASILGGTSAASAASSGPCNRPEGIYASGGSYYTAQNCRSTTVRLQLIIVNNGIVTHREACTSVAPGGKISVLNGVATPSARWNWTYC